MTAAADREVAAALAGRLRPSLRVGVKVRPCGRGFTIELVALSLEAATVQRLTAADSE